MRTEFNIGARYSVSNPKQIKIYTSPSQRTISWVQLDYKYIGGELADGGFSMTPAEAVKVADELNKAVGREMVEKPKGRDVMVTDYDVLRKAIYNVAHPMFVVTQDDLCTATKPVPVKPAPQKGKVQFTWPAPKGFTSAQIRTSELAEVFFRKLSDKSVEISLNDKAEEYANSWSFGPVSLRELAQACLDVAAELDRSAS